MTLPETYKEHKKEHLKARFGIISVSTTRTLSQDDAGDLMEQLIRKAGHSVSQRTLVKDEKEAITTTLRSFLKTDVNAIITTGGTGLANLDVTIEALKPLFEKEITGFAILFAMLGHQEIGTPAMLSRSSAGIIGTKAVFCVPGSPRACKLAVERLILPEIGHILKHTTEGQP